MYASRRITALLRRVREQLMLGASQIKMMAGGGVTSLYDPLSSVQFTEDELRAGVRAAADWGTYVMVHVYTPDGIQRALKAVPGQLDCLPCFCSAALPETLSAGYRPGIFAPARSAVA